MLLRKKYVMRTLYKTGVGVLIKDGLTKGTLVLFRPAENTWDIYMKDNLSGGFFGGYEVTFIKRDNGGFIK